MTGADMEGRVSLMSDGHLVKTQLMKLKIADYVIGYIRTHRLSTDEMLPSENSLAIQFGVSRNVVRGALDHLRSQGKVYARKGKGFFVAEKQQFIVYQQDVNVGFSETFQEPVSRYESKLLSWTLIRAQQVEKEIFGLSEDDQLYRLKVLRSVMGLPLAICYSEIPQRMVPNLEQYLSDFYSLNDILVDKYGYEHPICKSVAVEVVLPTVSKIHLLGIDAGIPLLKETNVFEVPGGPVEYFQVYARSDRFKLKINV